MGPLCPNYGGFEHKKMPASGTRSVRRASGLVQTFKRSRVAARELLMAGTLPLSVARRPSTTFAGHLDLSHWGTPTPRLPRRHESPSRPAADSTLLAESSEATSSGTVCHVKRSVNTSARSRFCASLGKPFHVPCLAVSCSTRASSSLTKNICAVNPYLSECFWLQTQNK